MSQELPFLQQVRNTANVTLDVLLSNLSANIGTAFDAANAAASAAATSLSVAEAAYAQANVGIAIGEEAYAAGNTGISNAAAAAAAAAGALVVAENAYATANIGVSNSGVTAGTYGSGSAIPVFTVDSRGRLLAVSTTPYNTFTTSSSGIVPPSGGIAGQFLASDATFKAPAIASSQSLTANGNIQLSTGLTLQWGQFASTVNGGSPIQTTPFSFTFPNNCLFCILVANGSVPIETLSFTRSQVVWAPSFGGGAAGAVSLVRYLAVGF
jgi:hypothetical protein